MSMITVVSGTNRINSHTAVLARYVFECIRDQFGGDVGWVDLAEVPEPFLSGGDYQSANQSSATREIQESFILPAGAFYFIAPEYNGSIPGVLKYFIDACSARQYKASFRGKKSAMVGLSTGRAGNLRGLDHLTAILQYLDVIVWPNRLPVSRVSGLIADGRLSDQETRMAIRDHVSEFVQFYLHGGA
ncbi:MAG: NAD(P)H-dependent oxidoreductase [Saprospiraceae bacterium]|nr:NAD(P)H-dependent oxidoreductase [Saprospiraceae bacterium]